MYLGVLTGEGQQGGGGQGVLFPFHCSDETLTESSLGEETIYLAYSSRSITKGSLGRNSSRNPKQKSWRNTAWWLPHRSCSAGFLRQFRNTCPGNGLPTVGWAFLYLSIINTFPPQSMSTSQSYPDIPQLSHPSQTTAGQVDR